MTYCMQIICRLYKQCSQEFWCLGGDSEYIKYYICMTTSPCLHRHYHYSDCLCPDSLVWRDYISLLDPTHIWSCHVLEVWYIFHSLCICYRPNLIHSACTWPFFCYNHQPIWALIPFHSFQMHSIPHFSHIHTQTLLAANPRSCSQQGTVLLTPMWYDIHWAHHTAISNMGFGI